MIAVDTNLLVYAHREDSQWHDAARRRDLPHHGVRELWTSDRDFSRFPALTVVNPLVG
jgi:uncharacterized protein